MSPTTLLLLFFTIVTLSHAFFLILARHSQNKKSLSLWNIHYWVNGTFWFILFIWIILVQFGSSTIAFPFWAQMIGFGSLIVGSFLAIKSHMKLGLKQAMGYRLFFPDKVRWISSGLYSFLHNPMYDGFILILLGLGLLRGLLVDFYLAIFCFLFFNVFLATIEKEKINIKLTELL